MRRELLFLSWPAIARRPPGISMRWLIGNVIEEN
jgi:hypothetical protein